MEKDNVKILIVEDQEEYSDLYELALSEHSTKIHTARSYLDAIDLINKHYYHVAIFDKRLVDSEEDNREGIKILEKVFNSREGTGLILATGYPTDDVLKAAYEKYNIIGFINKKNYDREELATYASQAIAKSNQNLIVLKKTNLTPEKISTLFLPIQINSSPLNNYLKNKEMENLLISTVDHLFPICYSKKHAFIHSLDNFKIIQTTIWSRFFGKATTVLLGQRKALVNISEKLNGEKKIYALSTKGSVSVLRYFEDNFHPNEFPFRILE